MLIDAAVNIKSYWKHPTNLIALEFGVVSFSFTTIHNIFMLYFVDLFMFHYGLSLSWLWISQVCFVIWNFASNYLLGNPKQSSIYEMTVTYGGPVLAGVFLCPFVFQFSTSNTFIGIYFTFFLCLYDTIFNRVLLSRSIWLQENVVQLKDKLKIHFLGFVFASVASCAVFPSYLYYPYYPHGTLTRGLPGNEFRWFCLAISMLSFFGFIFSSFCHVSREGDSKISASSSSSSSTPSPSLSSPSSPLLSSSSTSTKSPAFQKPASSPSLTSLPSYTHKYNYNTTRSDANVALVSLQTLTRNVMSHTNMAIYILVNLLQVFSSTFSVVFLHLFIAYHVNAGQKTQATVLFICFFSPVVMNIILSVFAGRRETYDLLRFLFQVKIGISAFAFVFGSHLFVVVVFTIFSRAIVESVFGLLMFVSQDVDSEHHVKFGYRKATQRLVSVGKIGQAAAPLVGAASFMYPQSDLTLDVLENRLYYSTILVMLLSGCVQLFVWSKYTLHGSYLKDINIMAKGKYADNLDGRGLKGSGGYGEEREDRERDRERERREAGPLRTSFGDSLFDNSTASPNLTNIATISHKQVITVV